MEKKARAAVKRGSRSEKVKKWLPLYLMMLPGAIYLIVNNYIPMFGMIIAFKKVDFSKGIFASDWIGLKNFEFLFASDDAAVITRNTILYNVAFIFLNTTLGILFAIFICDILNKRLKKLYQSAILFPFLMSMVIVGYIVYAFFSMQSGIVNKTILPLLGKDPIFWYNEPKYWPAILIFVNTWKGIGYGCLIYISAINGIDPTYFEAAQIDGASQVRIFTKIVLPLGKPILVTIGTFSGLAYWNDWTNGLYYINKKTELFTIQNLLNRMVSDLQYLSQNSGNVSSDLAAEISKVPSTGVQMAIAFVAILPIILVFPFLQKY